MIDVLEHFDDFRLGPAAPVDAGLARGDAVAMQHLAHLRRPRNMIRPAVVADQEAETVADAPGLCRLSRSSLVTTQSRVAAVAHDLAVALHRGEPPLETFALALCDAEQLSSCALLTRHAGVFSVSRIISRLRHRLVVIAALARLERIVRELGARNSDAGRAQYGRC